MQKRTGLLLFLATATTAILLSGCSSTNRTQLISSFTAEPAHVQPGETVVLSWVAGKTDRLVLNPGDIDVSGQKSYSATPTETTEYTLTAVAGKRTDRRSVTVRVGAQPFGAVINPELRPRQPALPDRDGTPRPVGASRDSEGVTSDFVIAEALLKPVNAGQLTGFLDRYAGEVIGDDSIPEELAAQAGVALTAAERAPTEYLVRFELSGADPEAFHRDAVKAGMDGIVELSGEDALRTLAIITNALTEGFAVSANYLSEPHQTFPKTLLNTNERGGADALLDPRFGADGSGSNVAAAWQFVAAHGIGRTVRVAIIDGGFWLDSAGNPRTAGSDGSDLPQSPIQYDFAANRATAGAENPARCSGDSGCPWHGNGAAGVAAGLLNNAAGAAGTGGLVAEPMLFHADIRDHMQVQRALRSAVDLGADIVNMSFGYSCNYWCRQEEKVKSLVLGIQIPSAIARAHDRGVMIVASAGNDGKEVGDPNFYRYCVVGHVFCVGALTDDGTTAFDTRSPTGGWASNTGDRIDIFAPTNIRAMADGETTPELKTFGGTSAAAPFVTGVAALIKAVNPALTGEQIGKILRETAHPGNGSVTRRINAYAAVLKAAEGTAGTPDRLEPNDSAAQGHAFSGPGPWEEEDLSLHGRADYDWFRFPQAGRRRLQIDLSHPAALGPLPVLPLQGNPACPAVNISDTVGKDSRQLLYALPAGEHAFGLGGGPVTAYNISAEVRAAALLSPDRYDTPVRNDTPAAATKLHGTQLIRIGGRVYPNGIDPRFVIEANLHNSGDVDWYLVRAANVTGVTGGGLFEEFASLRVYGNEAEVALALFKAEKDGTPGTKVREVKSSDCSGDALSVTLDPGASYLVRVSGSAGRYTLSNGSRFEYYKDRLPLVIPDLGNIHEYLKPDGPRPNELVIRNPLALGFFADPAYRSFEIDGNVEVGLLDADGRVLAGGLRPADADQRISLAGLERGAFHALLITPVEPTEEGTSVTFSWNGPAPIRASGNLIRNGGAEEGPGSDTGGRVSAITGWYVPSFEDAHLPTVTYYNGRPGPDAGSPGPDDRGDRFFAGGPGMGLSVMRQEIDIPADWHSAVSDGRVKFELAGFLGGKGDQPDQVTVTATFMAADYTEELQVTQLGPVTVHDRAGGTGLWPVGTGAYVPARAEHITVEVRFSGAEEGTDEYNDGYADSLELLLFEAVPGS